MEDVVLYYQPGSADGLSSLLARTETLLEPFTCRTPPVFTPWFPSADGQLPIRPAKAAPRITSTDDFLTVAPQTENTSQIDSSTVENHRLCAETSLENPQRREDEVCISETPNSLLLARETPAPSPGKQADGHVLPIRRSWSVFTQRRVLLQSSQSLSKRFHHMVSVHRLHLQQRAKWVITRHNCRDIEEVWRSLCRSVRSSRLPTCNANIQRERAEIWVFCDVLYSEQVGRFLKDGLQLWGRIRLSVHKLGDVFSM